MAGVYRPRHPERTVLYRVLFHYFEQFPAEYQRRFEKEYGFFRPVINEVVERDLDYGNPRFGEVWAISSQFEFVRGVLAPLYLF